MADYSYIVRTRKSIIRQAGDSGRVDITVPAEIDITGLHAFFSVTDKKTDEVIFSKNGDLECIIDGQNITVVLESADTAEKSGVYNWEMEVYGDSGRTTTIGKGEFTIIKETAIRP